MLLALDRDHGRLGHFIHRSPIFGFGGDIFVQGAEAAGRACPATIDGFAPVSIAMTGLSQRMGTSVDAVEWRLATICALR
jgi:hypothetical protein